MFLDLLQYWIDLVTMEHTFIIFIFSTSGVLNWRLCNWLSFQCWCHVLFFYVSKNKLFFHHFCICLYISQWYLLIYRYLTFKLTFQMVFPFYQVHWSSIFHRHYFNPFNMVDLSFAELVVDISLKKCSHTMTQHFRLFRSVSAPSQFDSSRSNLVISGASIVHIIYTWQLWCWHTWCCNIWISLSAIIFTSKMWNLCWCMFVTNGTKLAMHLGIESVV